MLVDGYGSVDGPTLEGLSNGRWEVHSVNDRRPPEFRHCINGSNATYECNGHIRRPDGSNWYYDDTSPSHGASDVTRIRECATRCGQANGAVGDGFVTTAAAGGQWRYEDAGYNGIIFFAQLYDSSNGEALQNRYLQAWAAHRRSAPMRRPRQHQDAAGDGAGRDLGGCSRGAGRPSCRRRRLAGAHARADWRGPRALPGMRQHESRAMDHAHAPTGSSLPGAAGRWRSAMRRADTASVPSQAPARRESLARCTAGGTGRTPARPHLGRSAWASRVVGSSARADRTSRTPPTPPTSAFASTSLRAGRAKSP